MEMRHFPATCRMFWTILSKVPWPPRSGRIRLWVSRSPSSVTLTPFRPSGTRRSTIAGVSSRPLVMMLIVIRTPRCRQLAGQPLGEVEQHRQVEQRLAAEERQRRSSTARTASSRCFGPLGDPRRGLERHLGGVLVVVAVIALDAVVAREVALQRGQHRDPQLLVILADVVEELVEPGVRLAAGDDEAVLGQRVDRLALVAVETARRRGPTRSSMSATSRDTISCASVNVFIRNTSSRPSSGTRTLNIEGCMGLLCAAAGDRSSPRGRGAATPGRSATDIPAVPQR